MPMPRVHFDFGERGAKTITKVQECHKTKEKKKGKTDSCREPHVPLVAPARPQGFTPPWPGLYPGITPLLLWASGWTSRSPQAYENIGRAWETSFPSDAGSGLNPSSDRYFRTLEVCAVTPSCGVRIRVRHVHDSDGA